MCRMIAAVGVVDLGSMARALRLMASNRNPASDHEKRALGPDYTHEDGWGVAWREGGTLRRIRSAASCLTDPRVDELKGIRTGLAILHARRASRPGSVRIENTHPFLLDFGGRRWAFCHNGVVDDVDLLEPPPGLTPEGDMDSELLFHHILGGLILEDPAGSILRAVAPLRDYTSLHSFLAGPEAVCALAKRHPAKSLRAYHALWEGRGTRIRVISSEPVDGVGCSAWSRISEPGVMILRRGNDPPTDG